MAKAHVQDLASTVRPARLSILVARARDRILTAFDPPCPYRVGDAVVGDDPFNGRQEGIVVSLRGPSVELCAPAGVYFYDHRHLRPQD